MESDLFSKYPCVEKVLKSAGYDYIYLSPHLDDVSFSCSGRICRNRAEGSRILIATLFAGEPRPPFSPLAQTFHQLWNAPTRDPYYERREEERKAMDILGADYLWLDWPELLYRDPTLSDISEINNRVVNPHHDPIFLVLCNWLADISSTYPHARIVAPLGIGAHRDHGVTFQASLEALDHGRLLFFEDFPYAAYLPEEAIELAKTYHLTPIQVDISNCLEQRTSATEAYQSQIATIFFPPSRFREIIQEYTSSLGRQGRFVERYWKFSV